jgi:ATP-dependent DNA helicase DinG
MIEDSNLERLLGPGGKLSRLLPEYEFRSQQLEMSEIVYQGLQEGKHVVVEAGTGTGKTLAYLVPAVLSGHKVIVSTGTKALQEQLFYKDLPLLRSLLDKPFRAAYMKGRSNYLCLTRYHQFNLSPLFEHPEDAKRFQGIRQWLEETTSGDVSELADLQENAPLWRQINSQAEICQGVKCPVLERCFITAMRREAFRADLVIVNHHLFFADLAIREKGVGEVIPAYDAVIFDEAHLIEETATHYLGFQVSNYRLEELSRDTRRGSRKLSKKNDIRLVEGICDAVEKASKEFFLTFLHGTERFRLVPSTWPEDQDRRGNALLQQLKDLTKTIREIADTTEELASCARRSSEIFDELKMLMEEGDHSRVYWCEIRGKGVFLHASPIDVSEDLHRRIFDHVPSAILTSATLATGGSFEFIKRRLGITDAIEKIFPSPFDFRSQALLYLPRMKSDPSESDFDREASREIAEILEITQGRAFVLFTSKRNLDAVYALLDGKCDFKILKQGDASREELLRTFRKDTQSVLFATRSFWQGIDVPGESLSCVIVDKLPFASPQDPVVSARIDAIQKGGGNPFYDYQLPEAAIALKQGFGRLIRSKNDRGILSILDKRIYTRAYGKYFLRCLAPSPVSTSLDDIHRFFRSGPSARTANTQFPSATR